MRTREIKTLAKKFNTQNSFLKFLLERDVPVTTRIAEAASIGNLRARLTELRKTGLSIERTKYGYLLNKNEGTGTTATA